MDISVALQEKDVTIEDLRKQIAEKDAKIQELLSQLDKFKSILPYTSLSPATSPTDSDNRGVGLGDRKNQRAWGISAEPSSKSPPIPPPPRPKRASKEQRLG